MKIELTKIPGAYAIKREPFLDERGSFARLLCKKEFEDAGILTDIVQISLSTNNKKSVLRGLHMQSGIAAEDKLVTCLRGSIFDVCVDMREESPTYLQWAGMTLSEENGTALYIPKGCAHGFLTVTDDTQVLYFISQHYTPSAETGYRFDDPAFGIEWPNPGPYIMSEKDKNWEYIVLP